jgi:VanZ family protein
LNSSTGSDHRRPGWLIIILRWLPPFAWMAAIFAVSNTPGDLIPSAGPWDLLLKKGGHLASYAVLAWLWLQALRPVVVSLRVLLTVFAIVTLYAVTDEIHQTFVAGRSGTPVDVLIDAAGALLGILLWCWWRARRA